MKEIKVVDYKEVIQKVFDLSMSYNACVRQKNGQFTDTDDSFESLEAYLLRRRESELFRYLNELDIDTVKV